MNANREDKDLELTILILTIIIFTSYTISALYVLIKVKFQLDKSALFTIFAYITALLMKLIYWIMEEAQSQRADDFKIPEITATYVIIGLFYFFGLEMRIVYLRLECQSATQFQPLYRNTIILWSICFFSVVFRCISYILQEQLTKNEDGSYTTTGNIMIAIYIPVTFFSDSFLLVQAWRLFFYFVERKLEKMKEEYQSFSKRQIITIRIIMIVLIINGIQIISVAVMSGLLIFYSDDHWFQVFYQLFTFLWYSVIVFINGMAMLMLFLYVGLTVHEQRKRIKQSKQEKQALGIPGNKNSDLGTESLKNLLDKSSRSMTKKDTLEPLDKSQKKDTFTNSHPRTGTDNNPSLNDRQQPSPEGTVQSGIGNDLEKSSLDSEGQTASKFRSFLMKQIADLKRKNSQYDLLKEKLYL